MCLSSWQSSLFVCYVVGYQVQVCEKTNPTGHQPLMAWETVNDGMGGIHCFTGKVIV
jgi:hypothetical protein